MVLTPDDGKPFIRLLFFPIWREKARRLTALKYIHSLYIIIHVHTGPLLTLLMDELKLKSINRLKPNFKIKFWSGFDTTILNLLYTIKETQPSLDKADDLFETDYSGALMIELHLVQKKYYIKVTTKYIIKKIHSIIGSYVNF